MTPVEMVQLALQASMVLMVLGVGLQCSRKDLSDILARPDIVLRAMVAVNLVVPLAAIILCLIFPLAPAARAGIVIMAVSPLSPLVLGKMLKIGAVRAHVVGAYFMLVLASVLIVPLTVEALSLGLGRDFGVPASSIFALVAVTVLLPLCCGILVGSLLPGLAAPAARVATILGLVLFLPIVVLLLYRSGAGMLALAGNGTLLVIALTILAGFAAGHLLGGPDPQARLALAHAATTRHPAIAALIAGANFQDRGVMLAIFLFLFAGILFSALYGAWLKKRYFPAGPAGAAAATPAS